MLEMFQMTATLPLRDDVTEAAVIEAKQFLVDCSPAFRPFDYVECERDTDARGVPFLAIHVEGDSPEETSVQELHDDLADLAAALGRTGARVDVMVDLSDDAKLPTILSEPQRHGLRWLKEGDPTRTTTDAVFFIGPSHEAIQGVFEIDQKARMGDYLAEELGIAREQAEMLAQSAQAMGKAYRGMGGTAPHSSP